MGKVKISRNQISLWVGDNSTSLSILTVILCALFLMSIGKHRQAESRKIELARFSVVVKSCKETQETPTEQKACITMGMGYNPY